MLLRIKASSGGTSGSWRTRVELGPGQYHFEGRVRTVGVDAAGGAVSLRLSGSPRTRVITPDGQWTPLSSTFKIEQEQADVELVCEFDSTTGEAAFDEGSLRLVRDGGL